MTTFVVLDFETTGLSPRRGEILETGAVRVEGGRVVATLDALSRPSRPIPARASEVHGITEADVAACPPFREVLPALVEFLADAVLVAHHARFDTSFLAAALRREGRPPLTNHVWCTVRLSRRLFPELERHDLGSLCLTHGLRRRAAHRALDDARATAELLGILLERAEECGVSHEELAAWGSPPSGPAAPRIRPWTEEEKAALEDAIVTGDRLELGYVSRRGLRTTRVVVPYVVEGPETSPRLVAYDVAAGQTRAFRLDRVVTLSTGGREWAALTDSDPLGAAGGSGVVE
jgi:DNA polymerase III epsilon subunit family exonuclease